MGKGKEIKDKYMHERIHLKYEKFLKILVLISTAVYVVVVVIYINILFNYSFYIPFALYKRNFLTQ